MIPQQAPNSQLLQVALTNVHLFEAPASCGDAPNLLAFIAEVTGIPAVALALAEHRVASTGSLAPLRELFANPAVPKADGLRYELTVKQLHRGQGQASREQMAQRLSLAMASGRGQVAVDLTVVLSRRPGTRQGAERQTAKISVSYRVESARHHHAFKQEVTIAGDRPRVVIYDAQAA